MSQPHVSSIPLLVVPPYMSDVSRVGTNVITTASSSSSSRDSAFYRETSTVPSTASATCASRESKLAQGSSATLLPQSNAAERAGRTSSLAVELVKQRVLRLVRRSSNSLRQSPLRSTSVPISKHSHRAASPVTTAHNVPARSAHRCRSCTGSGNASGCRFGQPPTVQMTCKFIGASTKPTLGAAQARSLWCGNGDSLSSTSRPQENVSSAACHHCGEGYRSRCNAPYRCVEPSALPSSPPVSVSATTGVRVRNATQSSLFGVMGAALTDAAGPADAWISARVNKTSTQLGELNPPSSTVGVLAGMVGSPLSDGTAAPAVLRVCKCSHCRAAPLAAVNVFSIGATNSSRCVRSSSPLSESSVSRIIDTNTPELPCRRLSPSEDRGGGEEPSDVNLLALLTSASSSSCEGLDIAAAIAPRGPGMRYLEPTGKPASQWRPPDALLNVALSVARDCEVLDRAGDGGAEGDNTPQTPDVCEHKQAHAFRRRSLTDGRVWDAAAPHIRHTSAGKVVMVPDDSSRCYPEAALASLQKEVEKTHCDDRGAPSWMLDTSTAPHLSLPVMLRGGRGDADNRVPPATAQTTPSLPLNLSHTSGSCVLVNTGLGTEPSSTALTTPACVAMTVSEAPPMATTRRRSFNSDTSLLDSFRVVLSPCPCSIAPVFSLVPFRATSPVSIPARTVQQRLREHVRARTGVGVWNAGGGTTPLIGAAAPSPCSPAERALKLQVTPRSLHPAKNLVSDIAAGGGACDAARFKSPQGWGPPPSRRSSGADDANAVPAPKSCSPSSSGAASGGWESVASVRQGLASIPPHDLSACTDPRSSRVHAPTMSLCMSYPYSMALSLDRTPPPTQQHHHHHHQQHTSSYHSPLVSADTATTKPWPLSLPEHAPSSPLRRRPTETTPLFPSDVGQRGGAGAACAVTAAPQTPGGMCGGSMCTSPSLMTTAMKGAPNTRFSAPSLASPWSASRTPVRSADARVGALWFPMSAATVQCHGGSCHLSPIDEVSYFNSTHRSHRQPSTPTPSLLSFKCPIPASAVEDSLTSSTTFADSQPRAPLHQFVQTKQRCVPGGGAPMSQLSPLQTSCCADAAGRCVVGVVTAKANRSLEGSTREGLASTCSTPPQRPLLAPNTPHMSGCISPSRGAAGTCVWKTTSTSARKPVLSSASLSRGSPLAGEERVSVSSPWATLQCSSPTAATAVGGPGSEVRMAPTRRCVRRLSCTAAPYPAPVESGIAPLYFGEELELRRLQSVTNVCSPLSISDTSVITAPSPTPHGDSGGLGEGRSALGSFRAHGFSAMPLPPPLPLTALPESHASPSTSWRRGSFSAPRAAATHAAPTREATHPQCISPQWSSPELRTRTRSVSWAAAMSAHEAPGEGGVPSDMLSASDSLTNAVTTTTTAATEGVPPSMPTPLPAVVPPTMQFHCAFSSLRGCRRTQEDSVMIVNDLRVRLRRRAAAEPITANAPTPVTEARGGVGAPSDTEAAGEGTEQAEATQSTTRQKEAAPHHIVDAHADVVFDCVGVFDGHCGDGVASFASKFFQEHFEHALQDLQEQVERDQQEGGGAMRVTRSSTSFREEPVKRPHRDHHEISLADAVYFQRAVSASLVQALMHLDLTCYNLLHNSTRGRPGLCRDAGSTASVAVFFKAPLATALRHSDVSGGISRSSNSTPLLATSDTVERFNGGGLATTCTPAASDGESRRRTGCDEVVPLSPMPTTCEEDTYRLCLANLGDSRAIIGRLDTGILLLSTTDHRISACPTERARIQAAGGVVEFDLIGGSLDVTRGLGDYRYKVAPAQWWASAATSSSTDAPEGFSSMPTGVEGRRTASTTSAMSSSKFEVVEGLVPPASTLRCGDAPAAGDSVMGTLRWQSCSSTPLRSPMSEDADGCEAAIVNLQWGARHARGTVGEARTVSVTSSCGSHPPGAAEGAANVPQRPQQQLPQSPLSPLSPPLPSSAEVLTSNAVSNIADVYEWEVHRGEVLIIASDGVWDRMNSEDVLAFVCSALATARRQPKAPSTGVMCGEEASGDTSNVAGGEGRELSVFDGVDAQVLSAADVTPLSFGGALACGPLRHPSPCCERRATSSHCSRGAAFCTPGGNEDVGCNEVHPAVASLPGPTGSGLNFSIVQAAARRLTEYVLHNLSGTDNTSAVVVVFH